MERQIEPYAHACSRCIWVGWIFVKGGGKWGSDWGNMYFCPTPRTGEEAKRRPGSVVIRFSDEPSDYWSNGVGYSRKGAISLGKED